MNEHTKTPWTVQTDGKGFFWIDKIADDGGFTVCNCGDERDPCAEANAAFIVRCCNAHTDLLEEHGAWARDFGTALLLFLQGDHSAIDNLARDMIIDQDGDGPVLRSAAIAKAEGRGEDESIPDR